MKISFEPPFTTKNADFVQIVRSKGDENQLLVAVMEMRNRQKKSRCNGHEKQAIVAVREVFTKKKWNFPLRGGSGVSA